MNTTILCLFITIALLLALANLNLKKQLDSLKKQLETDYWKKTTIQRLYGEPPLENIAKVKKQDEIIKQLPYIK